jgi:ankyrin repeat protein
MQALYEGDAERARSLLAPDEALAAPEAAAFGRIARLRQVLDADAGAANAWSDDGFSALALAIFGGQEEAARLLIERGADLETPSRHETIRGIRPIHTAAFVRSPPLARLLLDAGADVNGRGEGGFTALHTAAQNGDVELGRLLLARGADPSLATDDGRRPADMAQGAVAELLR